MSSIEVMCSECNDSLSLDFRAGDMYVTPCEKCLSEERDSGFDDGKNEGHEEGYAEGFEQGKLT